jgi:hypothetical protein
MVWSFHLKWKGRTDDDDDGDDDDEGDDDDRKWRTIPDSRRLGHQLDLDPCDDGVTVICLRHLAPRLADKNCLRRR